MDFVDVNESNTRWIQDFRLKSYASPAKLESIDGARYHAVLIPNCPGAPVDLANSGYLARILQHFSAESSPICRHRPRCRCLVAAPRKKTSPGCSRDYSMTGPSVYELIRQPGFASLPIILGGLRQRLGGHLQRQPAGRRARGAGPPPRHGPERQLHRRRRAEPGLPLRCQRRFATLADRPRPISLPATSPPSSFIQSY
uniref:Glutamine amidotransferase-like class 1 domain-containing protein 1 n=1 Tax=Ornithorhynchus anatinus TaxID=9258 RepID=F7ETC8_ORNAN